MSIFKKKADPNLHDVDTIAQLGKLDRAVAIEANDARVAYVNDRTPENRRRNHDAQLMMRQRTQLWREIGEAAGARRPGGGPFGPTVVREN
jgi:hypothetical protein